MTRQCASSTRRCRASCTEDVPLLGADGYHALWNARPLLVDETGLRDAQVEHLLNRYGSLLPELLDLIAELAGACASAGGCAGVPQGRGRLRRLP